MFNKTLILAGVLLLSFFALDESVLAAAHHGIHRTRHVALLDHRRGHRSRRADRVAAGDRHRSRVHTASAFASTTSSGAVQTGRASFYTGGRTASGGSVGAATCAHRSLPFGTRVLVTNLANQRQAVLTVNDRGPFVRGRLVDVSRGAAGILGMLGSGVASIRLEVLGRTS